MKDKQLIKTALKKAIYTMIIYIGVAVVLFFLFPKVGVETEIKDLYAVVVVIVIIGVIEYFKTMRKFRSND